MKIFSIYLCSLMILGTLTWTSCQENGQEEPLMTEHEEVGSTETNPMDRQAYEKQLKELSLYMGEVMKDPEARAELFGFGDIKGNSREISYNLRLLFDEKVDPLSRKQSAIVRAFHQATAFSRTSGSTATLDSPIFFIRENDAGFYPGTKLPIYRMTQVEWYFSSTH